MLELSHAIRHPSESKNNVPSISDTVKTLLFFSFFFLYIYRGTVFLSVRSRSSETRPELRSPGERSRAFLGAGRQTVLLCQLQVHRERQGSCCWRGVLSTSDFFLALKSRRSRRTRVRPTLVFVSVFCHRQGYKISHDVGTGIIQMTVEQFTRANEGTYTVQINDGKAKTQSSLVLVGDGEDIFTAPLRQMNGFLIGGFR